MRAIEIRMIKALQSKRNFHESNTSVEFDNGNTYVYLFGNCIYKVVNGKAYFTLAGWNTPTTRSRLSALGIHVTQKNWMPYYNGVLINTNVWYKAD
ncbi:MAG: hypothetical protein J6X18_07415 [Bacteroidales bacterium]|nr:hypothetical protein [Bacteroidales bacterium]